MRTPFVTAAVLSVLFASDMAAAQTPPMAMPMSGTSAGAAMMQPMQKMQAAMSALPMTGNTDQQFAAMMVPHHQAAIDMAKVELASGSDPAMRRLAESIIAAQRTEITQMGAWLAKHPQ